MVYANPPHKMGKKTYRFIFSLRGLKRKTSIQPNATYIEVLNHLKRPVKNTFKIIPTAIMPHIIPKNSREVLSGVKR